MPNQFAQRYVFRYFTNQCNSECASNRASKSLHPKMDDDHTGPLGSADYSGSSYRTYESSSSAFFTRNAPFISSTGVLTNSSDWKLNPNLFQAIVRTWGPLEVDLFASCLTYQLPQFVSWKPDPLAIQTDAFAMNWQTILGYAFPPFAFIARCLWQVISQKVEQLIIIATVWPTQPWYPVVLQLCTDLPLVLPMSPDLLMKDNQPHPLTNLQLAGWTLSANVSKQLTFQKKLERFCWQHGDKTPPMLMPQLGISGLAGVVNKKLIPFQYLGTLYLMFIVRLCQQFYLRLTPA
jgi:hypothetical protein